jgi:GH15 family glucan-1,4-alpha-glucosidase
MSRTPGRLEDYALIGDLHTAALVGTDGGIDWLCLPRFDSPACFATLLDDERAGTWRIAPAGGGAATRRRYRGDTLVLETEWDTPDGTVRVVDAMPPRRDDPRLVRVVAGVRGTVPVRLLLRPRFDYGHVDPWVRGQGNTVSAAAGPDTVWLHGDVPLSAAGSEVVADFTVAAGETRAFVLTHTPSHRDTPSRVDPHAAIAGTERFWSGWIARHEDRGPWDEAVRRALVTLKALTYAPSGGVVAAATTSLPRQLGGPHNQDDRRCLLRDATATLAALLDSGYVAEARAWREWLVRAVTGDPTTLQGGYGLDGARRVPEQTLDWLAGYARSTPVRVGDDAGKLQLNVWGEVLDVLHHAPEAALPVAAADVRRALLDHLEGAWHRPDNGLWPVPGPRRHFVHSKVMAWVGVDRAIRAVERQGLAGPVSRWRALRAQIRAEVCTKGYDPGRNTFTQYYGSDRVDAALLLLPRVGFLPWQDSRIRGTVAAVRHELCEQDLVLPHRTDGGPQGASLVCSFWLADALHGIGRYREARALFERLLDLRNDVGLLSEQYDVAGRRQVGNTPHSASAVALLTTARLLAGAVHTPTAHNS